MMPIYQACLNGDLEQVEKILLEDEDIDINEADSDDWTPLYYAVYGGNTDLVNY